MRTRDEGDRAASGSVAITRVEARLVRIPFRRPFVTGTSEFSHRQSWIVRAWAADGRMGAGEATLDPAAPDVTQGALARLVRDAVPRLASGDVPSGEELAAEGDPGRALRAGIDGALVALSDASGGPRVAVAVNAVIGFGGPDAGAEAAAQAFEVGFRTLTMRAGTERETEVLVERVRAVRLAVGPEAALRLDAGGAWDLETATERLAAVARFRIEHVAQPLAAWDMAGHAALREREILPVALDEAVESERAAREALASRAADVLIVRPARVGGPRAAEAIATEAAARGVKVVIGTFYETGVGAAVALRTAAALMARRRVGNGDGSGDGREIAHSVATAGVLAHDLLVAPLPIVEGRMRVPETVAIDDEALERFTLEAVEADA